MGLFSKKAAQIAASVLPATNRDLQLFNKAVFNWLGNQIIFNPDTPQGYIDQGYMYNADIYSIIKRISKTAACCPFILHEIKDKASASKYMAM